LPNISEAKNRRLFVFFLTRADEVVPALRWLWMSQEKRIAYTLLPDFNTWSTTNFSKKLNPLK
jgi:C-terminal processing protease CtpA/Prc